MNFHLFIHAHSVQQQTYFRSYEPRKKIHTVKCGAEGFNNWNSRCQILLCLTELFCNIAPQRKSFLACSILPDVDTVNAEAKFRLSSCALEYAWLIYMWFLPVLYIYLQFINFNQEEKSFCANKDMPCRYFFFHTITWRDIFTCFVLRNFDFLIPDAPELVHTFLEQEQDASCKRNAFMMLIHVDQVHVDGFLLNAPW